MSELLSTIVESGGDFITRSVGGSSIANGVTGTILTLTPPSGQRVKLTHLSTTAAAGAQVGISVIIGGVSVVSVLSVDGGSPQAPGSRFSVGSFQAYGVGNPPSGNHLQFTGKIDEVLTIEKNAGATTTTLYYGYEYGL